MTAVKNYEDFLKLDMKVGKSICISKKCQQLNNAGDTYLKFWEIDQKSSKFIASAKKQAEYCNGDFIQKYMQFLKKIKDTANPAVIITIDQHIIRLREAPTEKEFYRLAISNLTKFAKEFEEEVSRLIDSITAQL